MIIPLYENKIDVQSYNNNRAIELLIKLLSYTMKVVEWMMGKRLRSETLIFVKQFGFIARRSTTEAVNLRRRLMEF